MVEEREQENSVWEAKSNPLGEEADMESNSSSMRSLFDTLWFPTTFLVGGKGRIIGAKNKNR